MQLYSFLDDGGLYGSSLDAPEPQRRPPMKTPAPAAPAAPPKPPQPSPFEIILGNLAVIERRLASVEERVATAVERLAAAEELRAAAPPAWLSWPAVLAALALAYCLYRWLTRGQAAPQAYSVLMGAPNPPTPVFLAAAPNTFLP
jgi:hypothetical protein